MRRTLTARLGHSSLIPALCLVALWSVNVSAQVPDPLNAAQAPIPGSEHHYIGMGGETVNPFDGSVSFDLPIQLPSGRGLNMPFAIRYSGPEHRYVGNDGGIAPTPYWKSWNLQGSTVQANGWNYQVPSMTLQARVLSEVTNPQSGQTSVCLGMGSYVFQGFDFVQRTLNVGVTYMDPAHNYTLLCTSQIQPSGQLHLCINQQLI